MIRIQHLFDVFSGSLIDPHQQEPLFRLRYFDPISSPSIYRLESVYDPRIAISLLVEMAVQYE